MKWHLTLPQLYCIKHESIQPILDNTGNNLTKPIQYGTESNITVTNLDRILSNLSTNHLYQSN